MAYDPFARGPFPVGVETITLRGLAVELWFPAVSSSSGLDLREDSQDRFRLGAGPEQRQQAVRDAVPRLGSFPLVVYAHRRDGHRREWTALCTRVASHGFVVAAADHIAEPDGWPAELSGIVEALATGRGGAAASYVDRDRIAVVGAGLGGSAALAAIAGDARIGVAAIVEPAVPASLDTGWARLVPTLIIAAAATLEASRELAGRLRTPRRLLAVSDQQLEEATGREGIAAVILAHLDAHLRNVEGARELLACELESWLEPRGVRAAWDV